METECQSSPVCIDLFCGLFGWGESFASAGYRVIGFDVENQFANFGKQMPDNCELVVRDVRSITGADLVKQYGVPACIVASPPCQEFSYMAMPWTKAKKKEQEILSNPAERTRLTDLFNQCFRIQREVSEEAGRYVPIVIENVRGAQKWVGKARWNFGSFYLWGDVPALMPIPGKVRKTPEGSWDLTRKNYNPDHKWETDGQKVPGFRFDGSEGVKGFTPHGQPLGKNELGLKYGSKSPKRKEASAIIAKIPRCLADWIAKCFLKPPR